MTNTYHRTFDDAFVKSHLYWMAREIRVFATDADARYSVAMWLEWVAEGETLEDRTRRFDAVTSSATDRIIQSPGKVLRKAKQSYEFLHG